GRFQLFGGRYCPDFVRGEICEARAVFEMLDDSPLSTGYIYSQTRRIRCFGGLCNVREGVCCWSLEYSQTAKTGLGVRIYQHLPICLRYGFESQTWSHGMPSSV